MTPTKQKVKLLNDIVYITDEDLYIINGVEAPSFKYCYSTYKRYFDINCLVSITFEIDYKDIGCPVFRQDNVILIGKDILLNNANPAKHPKYSLERMALNKLACFSVPTNNKSFQELSRKEYEKDKIKAEFKEKVSR